MKTTEEKQKEWSLGGRGGRMLFLIFAAVGFALYGSTLHHDFYFDDIYNIAKNPYVQDLRFFLDYFFDYRTHSALPENSPYRPLCTLIYAILWTTGDGATWPYHLYKILGHISVAWLIFRISSHVLHQESASKKTGLWAMKRVQKKQLPAPEVIAAASALLFLVHPAATETVNYISSTSTLQCTLFYLAAFWLGIRGKLFGMAALYLLAMLTKEEGASLPAAFFLYAWLFRDRTLSLREFSRELRKPLFVLSGTLLTYLTLLHFLGSETVVFSSVSRSSYFFTQIRAWMHYLLWIVAPFGFSIEYMSFEFSNSFFELRVIASAAALLAIFFFAYQMSRPRSKLPALPFLTFGIGWFAICLLPASSIFPLSEPINEHRYYLSYSLLFPSLVYGAILLTQKFRPEVSLLSRWSQATFVLLIVALSALTLRQNNVWKDGLSLWKHVSENDPVNARAFNNLGVVYLNQGRYEKALKEFHRCSSLWPNWKYCYINQVAAYSSLGRIPEARRAAERLVQVDPNSSLAKYHYAKFMLQYEKDIPAALQAAQECDRIANGHFVPCLEIIHHALRALGRHQESIKAARRALDIEPRNQTLRFQLGLALIDAGAFKDAEGVFLKLLEQNPEDTRTLHNLAWISKKTGNMEGAKQRWSRIREIASQKGDRQLLNQSEAELRQLGQ